MVVNCKPWVTNIVIVPHTLGALIANITYMYTLLEYINREFEITIYGER